MSHAPVSLEEILLLLPPRRIQIPTPPQHLHGCSWVAATARPPPPPPLPWAFAAAPLVSYPVPHSLHSTQMPERCCHNSAQKLRVLPFGPCKVPSHVGTSLHSPVARAPLPSDHVPHSSARRLFCLCTQGASLVLFPLLETPFLSPLSCFHPLPPPSPGFNVTSVSFSLTHIPPF